MSVLHCRGIGVGVRGRFNEFSLGRGIAFGVGLLGNFGDRHLQAFLARACLDGRGISKQERLRIRQAQCFFASCALSLVCVRVWQVFERFKDQNAHEIHRSVRASCAVICSWQSVVRSLGHAC